MPCDDIDFLQNLHLVVSEAEGVLIVTDERGEVELRVGVEVVVGVVGSLLYLNEKEQDDEEF